MYLLNIKPKHHSGLSTLEWQYTTFGVMFLPFKPPGCVLDTSSVYRRSGHSPSFQSGQVNDKVTNAPYHSSVQKK